jgi:radical SAM protein with 4Fe4S-binding SPASM domain
MTNLLISRSCNQSCTYCFAVDYMSLPPDRQDRLFISLQDFEKCLDFLDRSNIQQVRLLGGEPTLHPHFPELIQRAYRPDRRILVFSNGYMPESAIQALESLPIESCTVIVNMSATPTALQPGNHDPRLQLLQRLGPRLQLGYNISRLDFHLDFLIPFILSTGCRKAVRLGLAQPTLSGANQHPSPKQYPQIGQKITQFAIRAAAKEVTIEFDCGFVRCMFSDQDLQTLGALQADLGWHCNPVLDIDPDGNVYHCLPLSTTWQAVLTPTSLASDLRAEFDHQFQPYRLAGIYRECSTCSFKIKGECSGGCLSSTMRRFKRASH